MTQDQRPVRVRVGSILVPLLLAASGIATANAQQTSEPKWPLSFAVATGAESSFGFVVGTPGPVVVTVQWSGLPLVVSLVKPNGGTVDRAGTGSVTLQYEATASDVQAGTVWGVRLRNVVEASRSATAPQRASGAAPVKQDLKAQGTLSVQHPPAAVQRIAVGQPTAGPAVLPAKGRVFKTEGLARPQVAQIQNSDMIEFQGKQYEAGTLRSRMATAEATFSATVKRKAVQGQSAFTSYRTTFTRGQQTKLAALNAKIDLNRQQLVQRGQATGPAAPPSPPKITETSVTIAPGAQVLIVGSGFGSASGLSAPGTASLIIGGTPHPLTISWWTDADIVATIPAGIEGVQDGPAEVVVKTRGIETNHWSVAFTATRDVVLMLGSAGKQVLSCGSSAAINHCYPFNSDEQFGAYHGGDFAGWASRGNDVWTVSLKNGWTFVNATTEWDGSGSATLKGFQPNSSSLNLVVDWNFDVNVSAVIPIPGGVSYGVELYIVGPKGIAYH